MKREELEKELKDKFKDFNIIYRDALNGRAIDKPQSSSVLSYNVDLAQKIIFIKCYKHSKVKDLYYGFYRVKEFEICDMHDNWLATVPIIHPLTLSEKLLNASVIKSKEIVVDADSVEPPKIRLTVKI